MKVSFRLAVTGRARFLSHLECVDVLLAAFRRAGYTVALSQGLRPKPVISLAVARAVGVASLDELVTVEIVGTPDLDEIQERVAATLPRGLQIRAAAEAAGTPRPVSARYLIELDAAPAVVERAAALYAEAEVALVERVSPKRRKVVDVKAYAPSVELVAGGFEVEVAVSQEGSARPEEVARALAELASADLRVTGVTRIALRVEPGRVPVGAPGERQ